MSKSSSGGLGPAGGVGLEGQILAWLAAYSLGQEQLPEPWVQSGLVTAVGSQTARSIDDIAAITAGGGHLLIQSKKGLGLETSKGSPLGKAVRQIVEQHLQGVPDGGSGAFRRVDPTRDRMLIVTDGGAPAKVRIGLVTAVDELARLAAARLPFTDVQGDQEVKEAALVVLDHLRRELKDQGADDPADSVLQGVLPAFRVRVLCLDDGGTDRLTAVQLLRTVVPDRSRASAAFKVLEVRCQELARLRTRWATRAELAGGLEHDGFVLGPDPLRSADVRILRESSRNRVTVLRDEARIRAAADLVRLGRDVSPLVTGSNGNLALVGPAGAGKTAVALQAAYALTESGADVLFLTGDTLAVTAGEARAELGIRADLADVMLAWRGSGPATLVIDGLDITRLSDSSRWLLELVRRLGGSRWRVLATVRSYSLRHGPDWQDVFRGDPVDPLRRDPSLVGVRHLQVSDLTDGELTPLLSASPQLAGLFTSGRPALIQLLHNPFNLRIAAELLAGDPAMPLDSISTQHDLLSAYWDRRVSGTPDYPSRQRILTDLTSDMITSRRPRVADPATALDPGLLPVLPGLLSDDVLREDPKVRWSAAAAVGYSHPVLFDFAVAQLMLGRPGQPMHLLDALNADPDLSVIVRPSLDFHFSALWHGEPVHETFWSLAIRLDEGREGHVLASLAAAAACLRDGLSPGDLDFLIEACQGHGPISAFRDDARRLLMLIAGVMPTPDIPSARRRAAVPVIATAAAQLATAAEASEDIDLARLVAVVLHRLRTAVRADPVPVATTDRDSAAAAVMRLALTDPPAAGRADLASRSAGLVADAIINDSVSYAGLAEQIGDAATMNAWGMRPVQELLWQLPAIGAAAPDHARRLVLSVWDFEVTDDSPEFIGSSQILSFSTTKAREAEQARWEIGNQFPAWLAAALSGAVNAFLEIIRRSAPPWPSRVKIADGHPSVRRSMPLMSGKGYDTLTEITGSLASHLKSTAARSAAGQGASGVLPQILDQLADGLVHDEVWNTLLAAGAANPSDLGAAFLPLLEQGQLLDHPATHAAAAGLVRAISPILDNQSHARLERRILAVRNCTDPADHEAAQDMQDRLIGCLAPEQLQEDKTRQRLAELNAAGGPPETPPSAPSGWPFRPLDPSIPLSTDPASEEDNQLLTAIEAVSNALQSRRNSGQNQDGGFADLRSAFTVLAAELRRRYPSPPQGQAGQANYHSARTFLCAAADALTADPLTAPGTDLGNQILDIFLQALPPKADPETEPR